MGNQNPAVPAESTAKPCGSLSCASSPLNPDVPLPATVNDGSRRSNVAQTQLSEEYDGHTKPIQSFHGQSLPHESAKIRLAPCGESILRCLLPATAT
jgi:hypothetical protein